MEKIDPHSVIRVLSYNIHGGKGADRKTDLGRIAKIVSGTDADIVALQEVNGEDTGGGARSQSAVLAARLNMESIGFALEGNGRRRYGLALLSRFRFADVRYLRLPNLFVRLAPRRRGAILATVETPAGPVDLINTHLSVFKMERRRQLAALMRLSPLAAPPGEQPLILCGDLNAVPSSHTYRTLVRHMTDTRQASKAPELRQATFHARSPAFRIDHIFVSRHFTPLQSEVIDTPLAAAASDHLPLFAEISLDENL